MRPHSDSTGKPHYKRPRFFNQYFDKKHILRYSVWLQVLENKEMLRVKTTTEAGKYVFRSAQLNDSGKTNWSVTQFGGFLLYQDPRTNYIITGGFIYTINYTITILCRTATESFLLLKFAYPPSVQYLSDKKLTDFS